MRYLFILLIFIISDFTNAQTITRRIISNCTGDCQNGYGVINYDNGDMFKGNFKSYKKNGYGVYTWNNGDSYSGNWLNGKKHGYGEFRWASGTMWKGEWRNGEQYKGKTYWNQKKSSNITTSKADSNHKKLDKDLEDELLRKYGDIESAQREKIDAFPNKWENYYKDKLQEIEMEREKLQNLTNQKWKIIPEISKLEKSNNFNYSRADSLNYNILSVIDFSTIEKNEKTNKLLQKIEKPNTALLINSNLLQYIYIPKNGYLKRESISDNWEKKQVKKYNKAGYIKKPFNEERYRLIESYTKIGPRTFYNKSLVAQKKEKLKKLKSQISKLKKQISVSKQYERCLDYIKERDLQFKKQREREELRKQQLEEGKRENQLVDNSNSYEYNLNINDFVKDKTFLMGDELIFAYGGGTKSYFSPSGVVTIGYDYRGQWRAISQNAILISELYDSNGEGPMRGEFQLQRDGSLSGYLVETKDWLQGEKVPFIFKPYFW